MSKNLADYSSSVLWKVELIRNTTGYLGKEAAQQSVKVVAWGTRTEDLENSQSIHRMKNETACSEESTEEVAEQAVDKEMSGGVNHRFTQPPQQKPETGMGLYQQKHCPFELKGRETEWNERRLWDFLGLTTGP